MIWYPVPPYRSERWQVVDENGELVAIFETRADCVRACDAVNERVNNEIVEADNE